MRCVAVIVEADAECIAQAGLPGRGDPHRTRVALPRQPAKLQAALPDLRANEACYVISALAPIEAWAAKNSPASGFRRKACTEGRQEIDAGTRDFAAFVSQDDVSFGNQRVGDGNAQPAGKMVVAGPRETQPLFFL